MFNLNIDSYSIKELEDLLELPENYDESIIEIKSTKLRQNLINNASISSETKNNTIDFVKKLKEKLTENLKKYPIINGINKISKAWENIYNLDKNLNPSETVTAGDTYIIKQPPTPYGQSYPSEFYEGIINPLAKRILRQNINIDTRFRDNYYSSTSSNFHVVLPIKLSKVVSLQLSALELPNTLYTISQVFGNNYFVLEIPEATPSQLLVIVPDGNYDYLSLQNYLNNYLSTQPGGYSDIEFLADINTPSGTGPPAGSGRMIVGLKQGATITKFSINFLTDRYGTEDRQTPLPLKFGWLIGFRAGYYENRLMYVSEGIINLLGPRYIYLVVDDYNNSVNDGFYGAFNASILNKNILARISLNGGTFNYLTQNNLNLTTTPRQYFGPVDIQNIQIQLLDEYGRVLNLNNMDYSFCLTFQTIYDL
jgi:hypothetical protein